MIWKDFHIARVSILFQHKHFDAKLINHFSRLGARLCVNSQGKLTHLFRISFSIQTHQHFRVESWLGELWKNDLDWNRLGINVVLGFVVQGLDLKEFCVRNFKWIDEMLVVPCCFGRDTGTEIFKQENIRNLKTKILRLILNFCCTIRIFIIIFVRLKWLFWLSLTPINFQSNPTLIC